MSNTKDYEIPNLLAYVAAPYSHKDPKVVEERMVAFKKAMAQLATKFHVVSPLFFHYTIQYNSKLGTDWDFWKGYSDRLLSKCERLIVLCLPEWTTSTGVRAEINFANLHRKPISYVEMVGDEVSEISWIIPLRQ